MRHSVLQGKFANTLPYRHWVYDPIYGPVGPSGRPELY